MTQIRKRGKAAIVVCSKPFLTLAKSQARINGIPDLPLALVDHPVGGAVEEVIRARAAQALPQVLAHLKTAFGR